MTTKTAQFTPGPWVVKSTDEDINTKTIVDGNEFWIARVLNFNRASDDIRESQANANLIAAAPAMYDRHKDNHGMVQEALRFLYEGEYEEVKCLLNHIALNSKQAVRQAEGRQA